ncbi:MAG TPA: DEAD/DEAH box helicase, partial [Propionibacteriaceae bacterium]|nr:DEAD/DEAH box helicase [Propionibacteriaceae bacterium]
MLSEETQAPDRRTFSDLGVLPSIVDALARSEIVHPFPIQAMAIPIALTGTDMIGQARTGTGKT